MSIEDFEFVFINLSTRLLQVWVNKTLFFFSINDPMSAPSSPDTANSKILNLGQIFIKLDPHIMVHYTESWLMYIWD